MHLQHVHRHMYDTRVGKMSVFVMQTGNSLTTVSNGSNQTLYNSFVSAVGCSGSVGVGDWVRVDSSGTHADPVHPFLLGLHPTTGQTDPRNACGAAETPD